MTLTKKLVIWFIVVTVMAVALVALLYSHPSPQATIMVQRRAGGSANGTGLVTDKQTVEAILRTVDNLDANAEAVGKRNANNGLEITIFEGETARGYRFTGRRMVKDLQSTSGSGWYRLPESIYDYLDGLIQAEHSQPKTTVIIQKVYFGGVIGAGMVTDKQTVNDILQCVDSLEYYNDDRGNISGGGGIEIIIFEGETARRYIFMESGLAKDGQDADTRRWYRADPECYGKLEGLLQQRFPMPEFE